MNTSQDLLLAGSAMVITAAPFVLVKAIRRREWQNLFEHVIITLWTAGVVLSAASPDVTQKAWSAWPPLHWLWLFSGALFFVNWFGFSGWLFSRYQRTQKI